MRVAAVQLESVRRRRGEPRRCRHWPTRPAAEGAEWIVLPEFFTTGMGFDDAMADAALPPDGAGLQLLQDIARRHGVVAGGSFLCRDPDGHNRNAFFLVGPDGAVLGRHDKDLATMWEACYYTGGEDPGVIPGPDGRPVGAAVCWELMRNQTSTGCATRWTCWSAARRGGRSRSTRPRAWPASSRRPTRAPPRRSRRRWRARRGARRPRGALRRRSAAGIPWVPRRPYADTSRAAAAITTRAADVLAWRGASEGARVVVRRRRARAASRRRST
jgi:predicted amidohydrolase